MSLCHMIFVEVPNVKITINNQQNICVTFILYSNILLISLKN